MSDKAELKIRVIERKIETKADAFWFSFLQGAGYIAGCSGAVFAIWVALRLAGFSPPN